MMFGIPERILTFDIPMIKGQGAFIIKPPTMLCNLILVLPCIHYIMDVRHNMWQNELLGGGLRSPSAVLVIFHQLDGEAQSGDGCG